MRNMDMAALNAATATIRSGGELVPGQLAALLHVDSKADRFRINEELARAHLESGRLEEAAIFANRAWLLSNKDLAFLPVFLDIHKTRGDVDRVRDAYKQIGMHFAASGNVPEALRYFNLHHYAYQSAGQGDRYDYDFDILNAIEHLARQHDNRRSPPPSGSGKTRVAYLVFGATHSESVLVKLLCYFAQHHDSERFEVRFFVPESTETTPPFAAPYLRSNVQKLGAAQAVVEMPEASDEISSLTSISDKITNFLPDLLVTTAALADYAHYFLACVSKASARIALVYGPPEQYVPPIFDWAISATIHPLIDSPCDCTLVPIEVDLPSRSAITAHPRTEFRIPDDATLVMIVGRPEKFISREYWQMLSDILLANEQAFMLIVGIRDIPDVCAEYVPPSVRTRLNLTGYRTDYLRILAMADIVLDTFPSGGGIALLDAMALGIPVVTFHNDYGRKFDQTQWSPGEELFDVDELILPRSDFPLFASVVNSLISDKQHRRNMGTKCRESVLRLNGQPARMVRRCEDVYLKVQHRLSNQSRAPAPPTISLAESIVSRFEDDHVPVKIVSRSLWRKVLSRGKKLLTGKG